MGGGKGIPNSQKARQTRGSASAKRAFRRALKSCMLEEGELGRCRVKRDDDDAVLLVISLVWGEREGGG